MILQELLSLASNTFWINQKLSSRTSVCLLAAHTLQCTPLQIDASYLIPILVLCPNWVSVSNSLQNKFIMLSLLKDSFALKTSISLLYTSQMANNLGFLPLSFYPCSLQQCCGRWEGMQLSPEISACQTTSAQAVPTLTQFTCLDTTVSRATLLVSRWVFDAISSSCWIFSCFWTEFTPDCLATSWPSLLRSLLQRLCSHWCGWTGRGLTLVWRQGEMCSTVRTRGSKTVYW